MLAAWGPGAWIVCPAGAESRGPLVAWSAYGGEDAFPKPF